MVAIKQLTTLAYQALLIPVCLYQGRQLKRHTLRLPEPTGERYGYKRFTSTATSSATTLPKKKTLHLMLIGDSAAAGVGSDTQTEALAGNLVQTLAQQWRTHEAFQSTFDAINWSVQATTGHKSSDVLRRLYVLPRPSTPLDVMLLSVGVNDTTANVPSDCWQHQLEDIITLARRKFGVRLLIFSSLPPMAEMPALPAPLNGFIGRKATKLDQILQEVCAQHDGVYYMKVDFGPITDSDNGMVIKTAQLFARDGFHPSPLTYQHWAKQSTDFIVALLTSSSHMFNK